MRIARPASVNRRFAWCAAASLLVAAAAHPASAATAVTGATNVTELRVAFARTPSWTTVWTSVRVEQAPGSFAVIVPLPAGAFVDMSSDAWFEALEVATAPRVFPPQGLSPFCPGESGPEDPFEIAGSVAPEPSLTADVLALADDAAGVAAWAAGQGLAVSADLQGALAAVPADRFLCVSFTSPGGAAITPALRVTAKEGLPALPFSITRAGDVDVRVTAWFLGEGRGAFPGTTAVTVPGDAIAWSAKEQTSSYSASRDALLAADAQGIALESAGHGALVDATPIAGGAAFIDAVAPTYFERASAYGNASGDPETCSAAAKVALGATMPVGPACPRGDLAALDGECAAPPAGAGEIDAAALLCGPGADDLSLALSGAVPADTWLTRRTFVIGAGSSGKDRAVSFGAGSAQSPVLQAGSVDVSGCFGGAGGSGAGSSSSGSGGTSSGSGASGAGNVGAGSGSGNNGNGAFGGDPETDPSVYVDTGGCACSAPIDSSDTYETVDTGGDDCGGGSSSSYDSGEDDCSGDSSSSYDSGEDDCSGDSSSGDSSSGEDCGGDSSSGDSSSDDDIDDWDDWGDDGSSDGDTWGDQGASLGKGKGAGRGGPGKGAARRRGGLRLSVLMLAAVLALLPLRRRGTRKRREADALEPAFEY